MRVITGNYKGRHFDVPRSFKARPSTSYVAIWTLKPLLSPLIFSQERVV